MPRNRFLPGTRFQILGENNVWSWHEINQVLVNDRFSIANISDGGVFIEDHEALLELYLQNKLRFEVKGKSAHKTPDIQLSYEHEYGDFSVIPEKYRHEVYRRYEIVIEILRLKKHVTNDFLEKYVAKLKEDPKYLEAEPPTRDNPRKGRKLGTSLSRSSIRLWIKDYVESGYSLDALCPYRRPTERKPNHRLDPEVDKIIINIIEKYNSLRDSEIPIFNTVEEVTTDVLLEVDNLNNSQPVGMKLPYPHPNTIRNRIKEYKKDYLIRTRRRRGEAADKYEPVQEGEKPTRVNEVHEYDGTQIDLIAVDEEDGFPVGRVTFMGGVDDLTGYPTAWRFSFEPPSYKLVADTMISSILPKPDFKSLYGTQHNCECYGLPEIAKYDNGNEWVNKSMINACGDHGIVFLQCPTHSPELKGGIERYLRTKGEGFIQIISGATFNYMFNTADYNPADYACIGLSTLYPLSAVYVLDEYTQTWQDSRKGTPANLWRKSISKGFLPSLPDNIQSLRISFFRSETRRLQRYGIEIDTIIYQAIDTAKMRSLLKNDELNVLVRRNPYDISYVYVLDPINKREWIRFNANDQEYTKGLSIWKHDIIREYTLQKMALEVNIINLAKAKKHIRNVVDREFRRVRILQRGRRRAAAYLYENDPNSFIELPSTVQKSQETVLLPHTDAYSNLYKQDKVITRPEAQTIPSSKLPSSTPSNPINNSNVRTSKNILEDKSKLKDELDSWGGNYSS